MKNPINEEIYQGKMESAHLGAIAITKGDHKFPCPKDAISLL
jgi:hypothetical protein